MINIVTWSIVNNEISFIQDIVDFHLPWVDAMYILDTGSTDGTLEYLKNVALINDRLIVEEYPIKYTTQYEVNWDEMSDPFPEVVVRNFAINRAEWLASPEWLIQLDGDEVFLPETREIIEKNNKYTCIGHSTINPVASLEEHPNELRGGYNLYDPHVRIWKANKDIFYMENPYFKGHQYHCFPTFEKTQTHLFHHPHIKFTDFPIMYHLHWMYGNKMSSFFKKKNITNKIDIVANQTTNKYSSILPKLFWNKRNDWINDNDGLII